MNIQTGIQGAKKEVLSFSSRMILNNHPQNWFDPTQSKYPYIPIYRTISFIKANQIWLYLFITTPLFLAPQCPTPQG